MREIKFRQRIAYYSFIKGHIPEKDFWHYWGYIDGKFISPREDYYESQQYTGLKDRNDEEIYERDILRYKHDMEKEVIQVVEFIDGSFCLNKFPMVLTEDWEIVGYNDENPKLLKEDK